jgi:hypothetical protein
MEMVVSFIILLLIGLISAVIGSIVGLGGGIIIVPSMALLSRYFLDETITTTVAVGTSLTVLIFTALTSTITYTRQKRVDFLFALLLFITSGPAAMLGAIMTETLEGDGFYLAFGIFMMAMSGLLVLRDRMKPLNIAWKRTRTYVDPAGQESVYGYSIVPALLIGAAVGFVSGLFGIGGGSLFVPMMVLLFRFPPHVATATSMFVILLSSLLGSATHWVNGNVHVFSLIALVPGALLGGWLGALIAGRMSGRALMIALRLTLFALSLYLIWKGIR